MDFVPGYKGVVYVPGRATKEENLTSYRAFGGVAIQNRIVALFFLCSELQTAPPFLVERARSPPLRFDFKKFRSEEKKGDIS